MHIYLEWNVFWNNPKILSSFFLIPLASLPFSRSLSILRNHNAEGNAALYPESIVSGIHDFCFIEIGSSGDMCTVKCMLTL